MLKNKSKIIIFLMMIILLFSATFVRANNQDAGVMPIAEEGNQVEANAEDMAITQNQEQINYKKSDVYLSGKDITIDYVVDGNLFVIAETVQINSQIGGDAFIIANKVMISEEGYVFSNLFTMASVVEIKGVVYDVYATTSNLSIAGGFVYRDVKAICENLSISGTIQRNAFVTCKNISFVSDDGTKSGTITGDLNYSSTSPLEIPENTVKGKISFEQSNIHKDIQTYVISLGTFLGLVLILWLIGYGFAHKFLDNTDTLIATKKGSILISGIVGLLALPIIAILLLFMQITVNISLLLLAFYTILLAIAKPIFTISVNQFICKKLKINKNVGIFGMLIVTSIILWLISLIPCIGGFLSLAMIIIGLGLIFAHMIAQNFPKSKKETTSTSEIVEKQKKIAKKSNIESASTSSELMGKDTKKVDKTKKDTTKPTKKTKDTK